MNKVIQNCEQCSYLPKCPEYVEKDSVFCLLHRKIDITLTHTKLEQLQQENKQLKAELEIMKEVNKQYKEDIEEISKEMIKGDSNE